MSQSIFKNPFVSQSPLLTLSSVGNGTLTIDRLTHFTVNQSYTAICTAISPFTVFNIIGSLDGVVGVAVVGEQFVDEDSKIFITIQQGPTLFQIGDTFQFEVSQGIDLNQQNLDAYDELPQKNFGAGLVGQLKGNHNIRFSANPAKAFKLIGDLKFTSKNAGPEGNAISVEYVQGSLLTPASLNLQGLLFQANEAGVSGNGISIEFQEIILATQAKATIGTIDYIALDPGFAGNNISITLVGDTTQGNETVDVVGTDITIHIQSGVSTQDDVELALAMTPAATALIETVGNGEFGIEVQYAAAKTYLTGGTDQTQPNVEVTGNAIIVRFESGITTLQQVKNFVDASADALTLISAAITGIPENAMTAPVPPTFLSGGAEDVGIPGSEIVVVTDKQIKISFVDGLSTAQQIKTAIENSVAASALVDVLLLGDGTEMQYSPFERSFLAGGRSAGTFSFNTDELSDPANFFEGNASILIKDIVNQGDEKTFGESLKKGKLTLDDDVPSNISGPAVENAQKTINSIIQNSKVFLLTADASKVVWFKPTFTFTADILFVFPESGVINKILVANSPITVQDGEHVYVEVNRLANTDLTPVISTSVPTGENIFRLFSRVGDNLHWYDNTLQRHKKKIRIGEGGGGGTAFQEKIGEGNGALRIFPLTFIPSNEQSILLISSGVRALTEEYFYNPVGNQIEFVEGYQPATGQDVYVFYLTDGETLEVPTPSGVENVYTHTVTSAEAAARELTLLATPAIPGKTLADVIGGGPLSFNDHYTISVNKFQWSGFLLDGFLEAGDKIRFHFYS